MRIGIRELLLVASVLGLTCVSLVQSDAFWAMVYISSTLITILIAILSAIATHGKRRVFWIGFSISAVAYLVGMPRLQEYYRPSGEFITPTNQLLEWTHLQLHPAYPRQVPPTGGPGGLGGVGGTGGMFSISESGRLSSNKKPSLVVISNHPPTFQDWINPFDSSDGNPFDGNPFGNSNNPFGENSKAPSDESDNVEAQSGDRGRVYSEGDKGRFFYIGHCAWALLFGWLGGHFTCLVYERSRRSS